MKAPRRRRLPSCSSDLADTIDGRAEGQPAEMQWTEIFGVSGATRPRAGWSQMKPVLERHLASTGPARR